MAGAANATVLHYDNRQKEKRLSLVTTVHGDRPDDVLAAIQQHSYVNTTHSCPP
jgi:hypothetical protein